VSTGGRVSKTEFYYSRILQAAAFEIASCHLRRRRFEEILVVVSSCCSQGFIRRTATSGALLGDLFLLRGVTLERQLDTEAFSQVRNRLDEGEGLELRYQLYGISALFTSETVVEVLFGGDAEGGRFLRVVGAEANEVRALASKRGELGGHLDDVCSLSNLFYAS
jgi:CubicO group peptidase (beta-lactamase class C family)